MTYPVSGPECKPESNVSRAEASVASGASFLVAGGEICPQATAHKAVSNGALRCVPGRGGNPPGSGGLRQPLDAKEKTWDRGAETSEQKSSSVWQETLPPRSPLDWARFENSSVSCPWLQGPKSKLSRAQQWSLLALRWSQGVEQLRIRCHRVCPGDSCTVLPVWPGQG